MAATVTAVSQDGKLLQFKIDDEGRQTEMQTFDPTIPGAKMSLMSVGFIPANVESMAAYVVNRGEQMQLFQVVADMCGVAMAFEENGTLMVRDVQNPDTLLTQSMGHRLAMTVKNENWHRFSVCVRRVADGIVFGDELLEDLGPAQ